MPIPSWRSVVVVVVLLGWAQRAHALQPLAEFMSALDQGNRDVQLAELAALQQKADTATGWGRILPSVSVRGSYARNQYEAELDASQFVGLLPPGTTTTLVLQPHNQLDGYFELDVPLVDAAGWQRARVAERNARSAETNRLATRVAVQKEVARSYYQLTSVAAVRAAAEGTLSAAEQNLALLQLRRQGGVATDVDLFRATAQIEHAKQSIAEADLTAALARRALTTLTGVTPDANVTPLVDGLDEESDLSSWDRSQSASLAVAAADRLSAETAVTAAKLAFLPTLVGSFLEHLTNAPGFFGHNSIWTASVTANWRLDVPTFTALRSQRLAAEIARTKELAARQRSADLVAESWLRVHAGIAKSRAARAEAAAAQAAVAATRKRNQEGVATSLELVQAERDAFNAEVARIQADADLLYARAVLRLDAGRPLEGEHPRDPQGDHR